MGQRNDPYLAQWSKMTRRQRRYAAHVATAVAVTNLLSHLKTHADDLGIADSAPPLQFRECDECRSLARVVIDAARPLPRHERDLVKNWIPIAVMDTPDLAEIRARGADLIRAWPDRVDRAEMSAYQDAMVYHLERTHHLHQQAHADPLGPPEPITQDELRRRLRRDLTRLRGEKTFSALGGGGNGRADAAFTQFEPWLQQTVTALKQPLPPDVIADIVAHWRTHRGEFIFDDNTIANVIVTSGAL